MNIKKKFLVLFTVVVILFSTFPLFAATPEATTPLKEIYPTDNAAEKGPPKEKPSTGSTTSPFLLYASSIATPTDSEEPLEEGLADGSGEDVEDNDTQNPQVVYTPTEENPEATGSTLSNQPEDTRNKYFFFGGTADLIHGLNQEKQIGLRLAPFVQYMRNNFRMHLALPITGLINYESETEVALHDNWGFSMDPSFWSIYQTILDKVEVISYRLEVQESEIFSVSLDRSTGGGLYNNGIIAPTYSKGSFREALRGRFLLNTLIATVEWYTPQLDTLSPNGINVQFHGRGNHTWSTGLTFALGGNLSKFREELQLFAIGLDGYIPLLSGKNLQVGLATEIGVVVPQYQQKTHWSVVFGGGNRSLDNYYAAAGVQLESERVSSATYISTGRSIHRGFFDQSYISNAEEIHRSFQEQIAAIEAGTNTLGDYLWQVESENQFLLEHNQRIRADYLLRMRTKGGYQRDQLYLGWSSNDFYDYTPWYVEAGISLAGLANLPTEGYSFKNIMEEQNTYLYGKARVALSKSLFIQGSLQLGTTPVEASLGVTLRF